MSACFLHNACSVSYRSSMWQLKTKVMPSKLTLSVPIVGKVAREPRRPTWSELIPVSVARSN